jgi:methanogenic corrinoid protein MtbC1
MVAPGEDHSFGNQIVQRFMRAAGWDVVIMPGGNMRQVIDLVSQEWLAVVGFSISGDTHIESLTRTIKAIRAQSFNPHIGIMIGGAMVADRPELVAQIGADGTAVNAAAAVILAKKLLAEALITARLSSS